MSNGKVTIDERLSELWGLAEEIGVDLSENHPQFTSEEQELIDDAAALLNVAEAGLMKARIARSDYVLKVRVAEELLQLARENVALAEKIADKMRRSRIMNIYMDQLISLSGVDTNTLQVIYDFLSPE